MIARLAVIFFAAFSFFSGLNGCGVLSSLAEFDPNLSGILVDRTIAPADGVTVVHVTVEMRYASDIVARGIPLVLSATGAGATLAQTTGVTDANGVFATTLTGATPGVVHLAANIRGQAATTTLQASVQFVSIATGASLSFSAISTVGVPEVATVTILDNTGQRVLYYEGTVQFQSSDALATLPPVYQFTAEDQGQHNFDNLIFQTAGTQSLSVQDVSDANITARVDNIEVYVKTAPMLELSGMAAALAGTTNYITVRAIDISKHTQTSYTGTVHFTSTDSQAVLPTDVTFTPTDAGVKSLPVTLKTAGIQSVSAVDVNNVLISGVQSAIPVWVKADRFAVLVSGPVTAGTAAAMHLAAVDAYGNLDPNYVGPAALSSSDLRATLPPINALVAADAGMRDTNVVFYTSGQQTLSAQGASAGFTGQASVTVAGAPVQRLALLGPSQAVAGTSVTLVATAYDLYDNVAGGYGGLLTLSSSDANASLPGPITVSPNTLGSVVITQVRLSDAGTQQVSVTDAHLALSANASLTVNNAPAATFALTGLTTAQAGQTQTLSVAAFDPFGNPALDYTGSVVVSSDDPLAQLPPTTAFTLLDAGVRALTPVVLKTAGMRRVRAADAANPNNLYGLESNVLVTPLAASQLLVRTAAQAAVGVAQNVLVRAVDTYGNLDPNFVGTITLSSSDNLASLPAPYALDAADAGQVTLMATLFTSGSQALVAHAGGITSAPTLVSVVSSAAAKLGLTGLTDGRAGRAQSLVIQALDNFNNLVPNYVGSVQVTSSDANAALPGVVILAAADGGQKLVPATLVTAGLQSVTAYDTSIPSILGTQGNILVTAVADRLRVQAPSVLTAGGNFTLSIAGVDVYNNVDTTYAGTVSLSTTSATSTLPPTLSIAANMQGVVTVSNVALTGAGSNLSIAAQDILEPLAGTRGGILVQPGTAASLRVQAPSPAYVGLPFAAGLTAYDAYGNQATSYTGAVTLTSSDPGASLGTTTAFVAGGQGSATATGLTWSTASASDTLTATDTQTPTITGSQTGIVVRAGGAAKLRVSGATSGLAGHTDTVTVMAFDNSNNLATGYSGTIRLTSTDTQAVLPPSYAFTSGDAGMHTFTVSWGTAGSQRLVAQDTGVAALSASQNHIVIVSKPAQALQLVDLAGSTMLAGAPRSLQIAAVDSFSNVDPNYAGTISLTSSDPGASLPTPLTMTAANAGIAVVGYTLVTAGSQSLSASDSSTPALTGTLSNLVVQPDGLAALSVAGVADALAGTSNSATIDALDAYGNRLPGYTGTVHLTSSDPLAVLSGDITFRAQDQGSRSAQVTLFTGGQQSVTATDTNHPSVNGTQAPINVRVSRTRLRIVAPSSVTALQNFNITVAAVDAYGNVDPNYTGSLALTSSDALAFFGSASSGGPGSAATLTFSSGDAGQKVVPHVTLAMASSNASIGATDGAQSLSGQRSGIAVSAGVVNHIAVSLPATVGPGSLFAAQISAVDNANNVVTSYTGSLSLTSTDGSATLPSSITLGSGDAGSLRVGNLALVSAGAQTLTFIDPNGISGSATTTVAGSAPVALKVTGATSGLAGHTDSVTVTAIDIYGNPANGNVGVVTWTSSDAQAVLPGPYALGSAQAHTFAGVQFTTAGVQTLRASAAPPAGAILLGQQNNIVIHGASATRYVFTGLQDGIAGQAQNAILRATDAYGNLDANFTDTVALSSSDASVAMPATASLAAGQTSVAVTFKTAGTQTVTASGSSLSGTSPSIAVSAAAASRLAVTGVAGGVAGQGATATIQAYDTYNNPATGYLGTVALSSSDPLAALSANLTFGPADAGSKSASVAFFTPGTQSLTAADTITSSITGQQSGIVITAGQRFVLTGPASIGAGQSLSLTVQAVDNSNNLDSSFVGTVHFLSTDARATLPADVTFAAGDLGQKSVTGIVLRTAGTQTGIMATTLPPGRSGALYPITVSIAAAAGFTVSAPSSVTAGSSFNVALSATDAYGNLVPSYTGTAVMASNDANASLPATVVFASGDAGSKSISATLRTATNAASLTATDSSNGSFTGQQGNITVAPLASVGGLTLTGLTSGAAGHASTVTLTARDVYGNPVPQYRGTVSFSSSDALATLPSVYTFIGADHGAHTFSGVTLATVGNQSLTASDGARSASQTVLITPAAASFFALNTNSTTTSGQGQNVTLVATDAYGNVDINYAGTVTLTSSDPMALLPASYTFVALDAGRRTLSVTLQSAGTQSLSASAPGGVTGMQGGIVVNPGATSRLSISDPLQPLAGSAASFSVRALDAAGNVTPAYRGTTHLTSSDTSASLPPDYTYTSGAGGQRTTSVTFATAGNQSLTATDTVNPSIQGSLVNIAVAAPAVRLRLVLAAGATAGVTTPLAVQVTDNFNNIATAYTGTVLLNLSDAQATYAAQVSFAPADQGNKVVVGAFKTAGVQSVTAVEAQGDLLGATAMITIAPGSTDHYDVSAPATVAAGGNIALALIARDAYGNQTPSYAGTAHIISSDTTALTPANAAFSGGQAIPGLARATVASVATTFTATDVAQPSISGTSAGVTVTALGTSALRVAGATAGVAGHPQSVTVSARDIYNNMVAGYRGVVGMTSSDAAATLPANYAFVGADAGSHTFASLALATAGNQTFVATDITNANITGQQVGIAIIAGAATGVQLAGPASSVAGAGLPLVISATDAYGNLDTGFRGTVSLSATDLQASLPAAYAFQANDAGNHNTSATLATSGSQTLTAASAGLTSCQLSILVAPGITRHLAIGGLVTSPAGVAQSMIVRAIDDYNNTTPSYRGSVAFSSTDARATLPGNYTFLSGDAGSKSLSATFLNRGLQQVGATDVQNPNLVGAQNVWVTVAQTQLTVVADTNVTAGVAFNVTLSATDAYGNINPNYTGTVHFTSSDPNAMLPGDVVFASGNQGIVTLAHQTTFKTASLSQTLTATDSTNGFVGSQSGIIVNTGPAAVLAVAPPATVAAGTPFTVSVSAYDAYNNLATSYTGHITFSASSANATLPPASTFTLANLGSKTFVNGVRLVHAGSQLITVTDTNNMLVGSAATVVKSAGVSALAITSPASIVAGTPMTLSVTAYDAYGNIATGMNDTVSLTGSDLSGTYPGATAFLSADAGSKTFTNLTTLRTAALTTVTATDVTVPSVTPAITYVLVTPASVASLLVTAPATVTAATNFSGTVSAVDAYLNVVQNYAATVLLGSTDSAGLPSPGTPFPVSFSAGSAAQRVLSNLRLMTAGAQLLTVWDPNNSGLFGSTQVQVNPGPASLLAVTISPNATAGQPNDVAVTALDAGANVAPTFVGSVAFASTDPNAVLPPAVTFASSDHGQKTLAAAVTWRKSGNQTLIASSSGLSSGVAGVNVSAASASGLQLYGLGNLLAGANNQATLRAIDAYGNTAPTYTGTVAWSSSDPAATLPGTLTYAAADMGSKLASVRLYTAGIQSVTATDTAHGFVATQANVVVGVQRSRFVVVSPNSTTAGVPVSLGVTAADAYGNLDANYTGALHFTSTDPNASFPAGVSIVGSDHGQRSVSNVILTTGSPNTTITVLDNSNSIVGTSPAIVVAPANANRLSVVTAAATAAGAPLTASVTAYDAYGNIATGYTGTVVATTTNANAILPAPLSFSGSGTLAIPNIYLLAATSSATVTVTDNATPGITGAQTGIQVTPLVADHFVLTGLTSGAAGHVNSLNVVVRDIYNNIATGYRGTVTFTSSDAGANLPANYTYLGLDQGVHVFSGVSLATVGTQSVTAHDTAQAGVVGTQGGIVIAGNSASHLALTGGASTIAGQAQNILITALDAYGNIDPNFAGAVSFSTTDSNAVLPGSYTFSSADAGTHLLSVSYTTAGTQTLTAAGPASVGSTQTNTVVAPGNANAYVLNGIPNLPAGQSTSVTVRVIDAYNNTVPLYRGQAHFTSSDPSPTLPSDYTFVAADNGIKALGLTLTTAGTQWVRATDTNISSITGQQSGIAVGVAQSHLQVTCNTNVVAGAAFAVTVTAVDAYGNLNTGYTGRVHFTSGDANATLPGDTNVVNANNGTITVPGAILRIATANQSITATDTNVATYTGAQSGIAVNPANANAMVLSGPAAIVAGTNFTGVVAFYDAFNNIATGYSGTVSFSSTDSGATMPASTAYTAAYAGAHTFSNAFALTHAGNQNVVVTDTHGLASALNVVVSAAAPATLVLSTPASTNAGNAIAAQVQVQDAYGNLAPTYRGTIAFSSNDPNASYASSYTFVASDNGSKTFSNALILRQAGTQVVSVGDTHSASLANGASVISVNSATIAAFRLSAPASVTSETSFILGLSGLDTFGNIANTYTGTVRLTSSDPNGIPSPTSAISLAFVNGNAVQRSVSGLLLNSGGNQVVYATDTNNPNTLNGQIGVAVVPLPASTLYLSGFPSTVVAGQQGNITVHAYDNYGNTAVGYAGTVHFVSSDANGVVPPDYTFTGADLGVHTFSGLNLRRAGSNQFITATDPNGITGTQGAIIVTSASPNSLTLTGATSVVAGVPFTATATALDVYGNTATGYTGTIGFTNSCNGNKPANYTFVGGDAGSHTFVNGLTLQQSGNQNVAIAGASGYAAVLPISVTATNANALIITGTGSSVAGQPLSLVVTAVDRYNNISTPYRGTVQMSGSDTQGIYPAAYAFTSSDAGLHAFNTLSLQTSGSQSISAVDANASSNIVPGAWTVAVSPNTCVKFNVSAPANVQPALSFAASVTALDNYNNLTPAYAGTVNVTSSDANGLPSNSSPLPLSFTGSTATVNVSNLHLHTLGVQSLTAHDAALAARAGSANITVAAQAFTAEYDFTVAAQQGYVYDPNQIGMLFNAATILPTYTSVGDTNVAGFSAGVSNAVAWDSGGSYLTLSAPATSAPQAFFDPVDTVTRFPTWVDTVDVGIRGGSSNVVGFCCGFSGPQSNPNSSQFMSASNAMLYSGYANGGGNTWAFTKVWDLRDQNMVINANSKLFYYVLPQGTNGAIGNPGVNANNSMYVSLDVVFSDGSDTLNANILDSAGYAFNPSGQGNKLIPNQWNRVVVSLASLAGKQVDHIDIAWMKNGATGGYRGFIDDVYLNGTSQGRLFNTAGFDSTWTPRWSNMTGYWPLDGNGFIPNSTILAGVKGGNLTVTADNDGIMYVPGQVNQSVYLDGNNYFAFPASFSATAPFSMSFWYSPMNIGCANPVFFGTQNANNLCYQPSCGNGYFAVNSNNVGSSFITYPFPYGPFDDGIWQHVAMSLDGNRLTGYINGVPYAGGALSAPFVPLNGGWIGADSYGGVFRGRIDEVATWNAALDANEIKTIYRRQAAAYTGTQVSQVFASPFLGQAAPGLGWTSTLPALKGLPSNVVSESNTAYSGLATNSLNSNLVALWHFEEPALGSVPNGDFYDDTGFGNAAYGYGTTIPGGAGIIGNGVTLQYAVLITTQAIANGTNGTLAGWIDTVHPNDTLLLLSAAANAGGVMSRNLYLDASGRPSFGLLVNGNYLSISSAASVTDNTWHFVAATHDNTGSSLYVDGQLMASSAGMVATSATTGYWNIGSSAPYTPWSGVSASANYGQLDELAVWTRSLGSSEIFQLYRRGANRVKYQLRQCTSATCADNPKWFGPSNDANSYFSEFDNVAYGAVLPTAPTLSFPLSTPAVSINSNTPYVQYRMVFESDDVKRSCTYRGQVSPCSAEVTGVKIYRINYNANAPTITNSNTTAVPYYSLQSFVQTLGLAGCAQGVTYNLSPDGTNWYYYNGSSWVSANGTAAQSNPASIYTSGPLAAFSSVFAFGDTYFKAFLNSNGTTPCALSSIIYSGTQ